MAAVQRSRRFLLCGGDDAREPTRPSLVPAHFSEGQDSSSLRSRLLIVLIAIVSPSRLWIRHIAFPVISPSWPIPERLRRHMLPDAGFGILRFKVVLENDLETPGIDSQR